MKADCKQLYGSEYPAAVDMRGIRAPLRSETRFARHYFSDEHRMGTATSRLFDGSASITISKLEREWETWNLNERADLCFACVDVWDEPGLPEMIRFMARHANANDWCNLAYLVALILPGDEASGILQQALTATDARGISNVVQGIAMTKQPEAEAVLRKHLEVVWARNTLWDNAQGVNEVAFDATACIAYLIEFGAAPAEFEGRVRQLAAHACQRNRQQCLRMLSKHYEWLT